MGVSGRRFLNRQPATTGLKHRGEIGNLAALILRAIASSEAGASDIAVRLSALGYLLSVVIAWPLYIRADRIFLMTPVLPALNRLPQSLDFPIVCCQLVLLGWLTLCPRDRLPAWAALCGLIFDCLRDQMFAQPYLLMYGFAIFVGALRVRPEDKSEALRLMVAGVYFWAGFHKLNLSFYAITFPYFISGLYHFGRNAPLDDVIFHLSLIVPLFESLIGLLLMFARWRRLASVMAFVMLCVVLLCLGPLGLNNDVIVWHWNIYLFLLEVVLFLKVAPSGRSQVPGHFNWNDAHLAARQVASPIAPPGQCTGSRSLVRAFAVMIFFVAPAGAIWGVVPSYFAFKLYSQNTLTGTVVLAADETGVHIPKYLRPVIQPDNHLNLLLWTYVEARTAVDPSRAVFLNGAAGLCPYLSDPARTTLEISYPPPFYSLADRIERRKLCRPETGGEEAQDGNPGKVMAATR